MLGWRNATRTMTNGRKGMPKATSVSRISKVSTRPPKNPAINPTIVPISGDEKGRRTSD